MINSRISYSAITAKVRTMYGRRLTDDDWHTLDSMTSVAQVGKFLTAHPGWREAMESLKSGILHRGELEWALRQHLISDYIKLYKFASLDDKQFLLFAAHKAEYEMILQTLRRLMSGDTVKQAIITHEFLVKKSKVSFDALVTAENWRDILAAVRDSMFYEPLLTVNLSLDTGLPDYTAVSVLLQGTYYAAQNRFAAKKYKGDIRKLFLSALGQEIDLLNLVQVMRLKRYFPDSPQAFETMLFPVHYRLRPAFFKEIDAAPSYEAAFGLIQNTVYGKFFSEHDFAFIDQYYGLKIYDFNRKQILSGGGSPYISTAYLALKESEMRRLFGVIEKAHYRHT